MAAREIFGLLAISMLTVEAVMGGTMNHSKEQVAVVMAVLQLTPLTPLRNQRTVRTLCGTEAAPGTIVCIKEAIV